MKRALISALSICLAAIAAHAQPAPSPAPARGASPTQPVASVGAAKPAAPAAIPDTIMFTVDEFNEIQSHLAGINADSKNDNHAIEKATLYLSTILYIDKNDWTIWVNGVPIGPRDEFPSFKVTEISATSVELLVPLSAQGVRPVKLGPNQTFIAKTGVVVEGRVQ